MPEIEPEPEPEPELEPEPEPEPVVLPAPVPECRPVHRNVSGIPVRRRPVHDASDLQSSSTSTDPVLPAADPITPSSMRTGDDSAVDAAAELPLWRLKDVFIEATTLDREIRMLRKRIDPKSRQELTRIINFCRERLAQGTRSPNHTEGSPAPSDSASVSAPTSVTSNPRPSLLRQPSVRAGGDASTKVRFQQ